jgi:hypothetical protein
MQVCIRCFTHATYSIHILNPLINYAAVITASEDFTVPVWEASMAARMIPPVEHEEGLVNVIQFRQKMVSNRF